jgi:hypothetical protein
MPPCRLIHPRTLRRSTRGGLRANSNRQQLDRSVSRRLRPSVDQVKSPLHLPVHTRKGRKAKNRTTIDQDLFADAPIEQDLHTKNDLIDRCRRRARLSRSPAYSGGLIGCGRSPFAKRTSHSAIAGSRAVSRCTSASCASPSESGRFSPSSAARRSLRIASCG